MRRLGRVKKSIECTSSSFRSILPFSNIPAKDLVFVNFGKIGNFVRRQSAWRSKYLGACSMLSTFGVWLKDREDEMAGY